MANGVVLTKNGWNAFVNRAMKATPDYTAPSRFKIGTGTTTPNQADTNLTTSITAWNAGSDYKNYNSSFGTNGVSFDTTNQKFTTQAYIDSTQANGNAITETGDFNTDGSPIMATHSVFPVVTKTSAIRVYIQTTWKRVD